MIPTTFPIGNPARTDGLDWERVATRDAKNTRKLPQIEVIGGCHHETDITGSLFSGSIFALRALRHKLDPLPRNRTKAPHHNLITIDKQFGDVFERLFLPQWDANPSIGRNVSTLIPRCLILNYELSFFDSAIQPSTIHFEYCDLF